MNSIFDPLYRSGGYVPVVHSYYDRADMLQTTVPVNHVHSLCEIMYVCEGQMSIEFEDGVSRVGRRQLIWVDAYVHHWDLKFADGLCSMMNIEFQYEALGASAPSLDAVARGDKSMAGFLARPTDHMVLSDRDGTVYRLMKAIVQLADSTHKQSERLCTLLCTQTMLEVARLSQMQRGAAPPVTNHYVAEALGIMRSDYAEPLTAASIAARLHIQPTYLHRLFREHTASTMGDQLQCIRMQQAQALLLRGDEPLADIAAAVGVGSAQRFSQLFRRYVGVTPAEYRKQYQEGKPSPDQKQEE